MLLRVGSGERFTNRAEVILTVSEQRIDRQDAFVEMADADLIRHADAAMGLDRRFANVPAQGPYLPFQYRDVLRACLSDIHQRRRVKQAGTGL